MNQYHSQQLYYFNANGGFILSKEPNTYFQKKAVLKKRYLDRSGRAPDFTPRNSFIWGLA
jgi:hypothetical protein